ncbi:rhomboid family intramembrane serine protease [Halobacterium litoreum]|uniref:Rhomboid family intramembrane serine protease n=1 Tax=Halobacterium litoreum TaxID=2039234 RepID=A0ABD5NA50_9EURY|nr:rhomboid family intramembrane serine protease [Halobacterium litoreum]UHH12076.1 rhomboid family intramembrane serine protease [Halobacterium litoreum]
MDFPPLVVVAAAAAVVFAVFAAVPRFRGRSLFVYGAPGAALAGVAAAVALGAVGRWHAVAYAAVVVIAGTGLGVTSTAEGRRAVRAVRARLLFGVPWGTLVVTAAVAAFYLFVQGGADAGLLVVPFVSWSYFYPLGVVTAPFAHASLGHVTGNLLATLAFAPLVEYAVSHYPTGRGESSFSSWRTNPYVRALVGFPLAVLAVGLLTGVFSWGATIGFSGVVYAFAGFALVRFPLATVVAATGREVLSVLWTVVQDPITFASASPSFGPPWWAGIAVQGHLFGFLVGAVLAAVLVARRGDRPSALRIWVGSVVLATSLSFWAVWWYGQSAQYVLFRALGVLLVAALALVLTAVVQADERTLFRDVTGRRAAFFALALPVATMAVVAVPVNLTTVEDAQLGGDPVEIRGYDVTYAEDVQNERVAAVDVPFFAQATNVSASGVIVASESRNIWTEEVGAGELAFYGDTAVTVGGLDWQETVWVHRRGWVAEGGSPVYNVYLNPPDEYAETDNWLHAYASESSTASPVVAGRQVRVDAENGAFGVQVVKNGSVVDAVGIPGDNETARAGGLTFVRNESRLLAEYGNTSVTVATQEEYE